MELNINSISVNDRKRKLNTEKVSNLAESFSLLGQLEPITVANNSDKYILLAGWHRLEAARRLGWDTIDANIFDGNDLEYELVEIDENLMNNDLTVLEQGEHIQRRNEILEAMGQRAPNHRPEKGDTVSPLKTTENRGGETISPPKTTEDRGGDTVSPPNKGEIISPLKTTEEIAKEAGLSERSAQRRLQIARDISPEAKELIRNTPIADSTTQLLELARMKPDEQIAVARQAAVEETTINEALINLKKEERDRQIQEQIKKIKQNNFISPTKKYDVIVIDPPWPYGTKYDPNGRRAANPYPEMSINDIKNIDLPNSNDCVLWLWTTHKFMRYSFDILDTWGFRDVAIITWVKDRMGLGTYIRSQSEFCIMALKGKPTINLKNQTTIINGKLKEHSRKPDEFYTMVNSLCIGYKLDYFSREQREGWDQYGNDTNKF